MKITSIKQQLKHPDRYSIFIDGKFAFSFSQDALLSSGITKDQELSLKQCRELERQSIHDKLYNQTLRYLALRRHSTWEVDQYLERKGASPALKDEILNKLSKLQLIDDDIYAEAYIHDRLLLRPTSKRKLSYDLRKKRVSDKVIERAIQNHAPDEQANLREIIERKRQQSRYQDDIKLKQYLIRQGFHYGDIVDVLKEMSA
jgi:regulatory protein